MKFIVTFSLLILLSACKTSEVEKSQSRDSTAFRVTPYLQNPTAEGVTLVWFSNRATPADVTVTDREGNEILSLVSVPEPANTLSYSVLELNSLKKEQPAFTPFQHEIVIAGLRSSSDYQYRVSQDGEAADGHFKTAGDLDTPIRIIVYADSETEPESTGKPARWPRADGSDKDRRYLLDQTRGYQENLAAIAERQPDIVAIAGDLVQSGGEQRDWDEFWRHNQKLASNTPIVPALGNHEYYAGPEEFGAWRAADSERSVQKFQTYFSFPDNAASNKAHKERYYALDYGPVTLIVLDTINGGRNQTDNDTNWSLLADGEGGASPDWALGSEQYQWLEKQLSKAKQESRFTFVMFHYCPYTSGVHGLPPGVDSDVSNNTSSLPLQALTPLFMKYGVDVLLNGHDEMAEHSVVPGSTTLSDGQLVPHELHVYDTGIGGDGLRGAHPNVVNPYRRFIADIDAPETYNDEGVLIDGGKHYGHLEINITPNDSGQWQAAMEFVYIFPVSNSKQEIIGFERRIYDDSTTIFE